MWARKTRFAAESSDAYVNFPVIAEFKVVQT